MSYKTVNHKHPEGGCCPKIWQHVTNIKRKLLAELWKNNILFILYNILDRDAWCTAIHGAANSRTWLIDYCVCGGGVVVAGVAKKIWPETSQAPPAMGPDTCCLVWLQPHLVTDGRPPDSCESILRLETLRMPIIESRSPAPPLLYLG